MIDGLVYAYRARTALQLPDSIVAAIRDTISRTARSRFWSRSSIRTNQINWYALIYAADAAETGDPTLLRRDFSRLLHDFFQNVHGGPGRAGNLGPGLRFHYVPGAGRGHRANVDSAEYANIVLSFTRFYDETRAAGMPPLSTRYGRLLGEWIKRAVSGYWTHAGLPELGHRVGVLALAPGEEVRARPAGAHRPRGRAAASTLASLGGNGWSTAA